MKDHKGPDGADRMTDAELSKKLGGYQRAESLGMLLGILCVAAGCILAFIKRDVLLLAVLVFGGVGIIMLVALPAQRKKKALLQQQLGGFFRTEWNAIFGAEPQTPQLPVDEAYMRRSGLVAHRWDECAVADLHEGQHKGRRFSAANVELRRNIEERSGPDNENWTTRTETLFRGVVIRCADACDPALDLTVNDRLEKRETDDISDGAAFRACYEVHAANGEETPELRALVQRLEKASAGKVRGLCLREGRAELAIDTRYVFANIPDALDMRDVDGVRKWYTASLEGMGRLLDILTEALSGAGVKA